MADLTGQTVASTYNLLLKVDTTGIDSTMRAIEGGLGEDSALMLSTGGVKADGTFEATGVSTLTGVVTATGGVVGDLTGDVTGDVTGAVTGNVTGDVTGNLTGNVTGNLTGDITGDVTGDVTGDITGDVTGDLTGAVTATGTLADGVTAATQTAGTNDTTVATTAYVDALNMVPAGAITQYGAASAPTGWLLCDGTAVSRTTYSALFAIVSTTYGTGDGSTTFNLPDLQDRIPVGRNDTSGTFNVALGSTGGVEDVTLTGAQSGTSAHGHTINSSAEGAAHHGHTGGGQPVGLSSAATPSVGTYSGSDGVQDSVAASAGSSHTNLQPYLVVNFIIKT